tara:strand:+ start:3255 stop:3530 length:276 start_codon:yes stop_codon:yes gene_type:complete
MNEKGKEKISREIEDLDQKKELVYEEQNNENDLSNAKWLNNQDIEVDQVFGFNENAELINSRAAMIGFLMLIITELVFKGSPVTHSIFGIG